MIRHPSTRVTRALGAGVALVAIALGTTGCGAGLEDVPMPSLVDGPTHQVEAVFDSALNLPVGSPVKLDGATVGEVRSIGVHDFEAHVVMDVLDSADLRSGGGAEIRLTAPMGTAFVELTSGDGAQLGDGAVIGVAQTHQAPDISDLLSSLSVVVTGGSFADISTIITQLNTAIDGKAGDIRALLRTSAATLSRLTAHTDDFDRALAAVHRLSGQLADDSPTIARAVDGLEPAVKALARQRVALVKLLTTLRDFGDVATTTITTTRADLVASVDRLDPVLASLRRTQGQLKPIIKGLLAFGAGTDRATPGDYTNFDLTFHIDPSALTPQSGDLTDLPLGDLLDGLLGGLFGKGGAR